MDISHLDNELWTRFKLSLYLFWVICPWSEFLSGTQFLNRMRIYSHETSWIYLIRTMCREQESQLLFFPFLIICPWSWTLWHMVWNFAGGYITRAMYQLDETMCHYQERQLLLSWVTCPTALKFRAEGPLWQFLVLILLQSFLCLRQSLFSSFSPVDQDSYFCKHCTSRWDGSWWAISSGSTQFAIFLDLKTITLWAAIHVSKCTDRIVCFRNSGLKELSLSVQLGQTRGWDLHWTSDTVVLRYPDNCRPRWLNRMRRPTGDQEVAGSTPAKVGNILSWRLIMKYFLRSFSPFRWFKKSSCQFLAKECAQYWLTA